MGWLLFILFISAIGFLSLREWQRGPKLYRKRTCTGRAWKCAFPQVPSERIRRFLICFSDGMAFSRNIGLKFHPDDQVMSVYRAIQASIPLSADAMECETFAMCLRDEFGLPLEDILAVWHDKITLGELFMFVNEQGSKRRAQ